MIQYVNSALILFYILRSISYSVYSFKTGNIAGGISVIALTAGITTMFIISVVYIIK